MYMVCEIWFVHTLPKLVPYDQYFASFVHELENQGCILFFIDAYAASL